MSESASNHEIVASHTSVDLARRGSMPQAIVSTLRAACYPMPIERPVVDPNLTHLPVLERIAEVVRYSILKIEYGLSSGGGIRAWFRLNLLLTILLAIPALLLLPIITLFVAQIATASDFLLQTSRNLFTTLPYVVAIAFTVTCSLFAVRILKRR